MKAYDCVQASRAKGRPTALAYIGAMIDGFVEMHGDRRFADDPAVVAGVGYLSGMPITVVGIEKGGDTADKVRRNFGSANPEGYRKALRQIKLAEKFHRPVCAWWTPPAPTAASAPRSAARARPSPRTCTR